MSARARQRPDERCEAPAPAAHQRQRVTSSPSAVDVPPVGGSRPARMRASVDLPEPLTPTTARHSPGSTSSETSLSADALQRRAPEVEVTSAARPAAQRRCPRRTLAACGDRASSAANSVGEAPRASAAAHPRRAPALAQAPRQPRQRRRQRSQRRPRRRARSAPAACPAPRSAGFKHQQAIGRQRLLQAVRDPEQADAAVAAAEQQPPRLFARAPSSSAVGSSQTR